MYPSCIWDQVICQFVKDEGKYEEGLSPELRGQREMVKSEEDHIN